MSGKTILWLSVTAIGLGIATLLLFTTLVNDVFFKEINFCTSSFGDLTFRSMGIFSSGIITGFMASLIVVRNNYWPHIALSIFVLVKMFFIVGCPITGNPLWFDAVVNALLISGIWLGSYGALKFPLAPI